MPLKLHENTEWTLSVLKFVEACLSLHCLLVHIWGFTDPEAPVPHNALFCATFGGYFILSLSGCLAPLSGQKSPPGVDMMFCIVACLLYYSAACAAMYYVERDPRLVKISDEDEAIHPFFVHCKLHCEWSLITGTLFLMHAVISADRMIHMKRGFFATTDYRIEENDIDIQPENDIQLHFFIMDLIVYFTKTKVFNRIKKCCIKRTQEDV